MRQLGELETAVMDRLWSWDRPTSVREVLDDLNRERDLAYTTVMTVMDNLHRKGLLARDRDGRAYRYRPTGSREEYTAELMEAALATGGDRTAALLRFVDRMDRAEVAALRKALEAAGRRKKGSRQ
ncbi:MAG: BlaI/MecI/CopY family transcriptional regulator [Micromonosporaceae bacterium]|nr:BlaI/MecI/CopY family transcriptional regulator [Micromonosporaceae bacterium]